MSYTVEQSAHGRAVIGEMPVAEWAALAELWSGQGYKLMHAGIASALGACLAVTRDEESARAWEAEIARDAGRKARGDDVVAWLLGPDTGTSSRTIVAVLSPKHEHVALRHGACHPLDPDDLGRCIRLLERFPAWRERLQEVADRYPTWQGLVDHWSELEALFAEEAPSGRAPKCYARMSELLGR